MLGIVVWVVIAGVALAIIGVSILYHRTAAKRGHRSRDSWQISNEALNNRLDVKAIRNPGLQGGSQDWMTYRHRDVNR